MGRVRTASKKLLSATQVPASGASLRLSAALPIARRTPPIRWGIARDGEACGIDIELSGMLGDVFRHRIVFLDRYRI
ncbi:MAG TPA: hypothetical protein VJ349_02350, partial [Stellaceae bacterium]|nr:hypothetical protein [Stellaceae bacterium]